ncbi:MAG: protease modulator HflC [Planctomycetes bacterium]|nr:protease modulator HflC [Planctomycetota bacterium]
MPAPAAAPAAASAAASAAGDAPPARRGKGRYFVALLLLIFAVLGATTVPVRQGSAMVITRFGDPRRVLVEPGLAFKWPAPFERAVEVDLRLRTTSSGLHDVGTKEGLRILVQSFAAWQVPADVDQIRLFLRAVRNEPKTAADQLRTFLGSTMETATANFQLDDLINTDAAKLRLSDYEARMKEGLAQRVRSVYGITVQQVGVERLTLPTTTIDATVERMKMERSTVAEEVQARGRKAAGEIRAAADTDARLVRAKANEEAAKIEAEGQTTAAKIYGDAYQADPQLYEFLRSLEVLDQIIHDGTRLILKTDAAPFRVLIEGPESLRAMQEQGEKPPAEGSGEKPPAEGAPAGGGGS